MAELCEAHEGIMCAGQELDVRLNTRLSMSAVGKTVGVATREDTLEVALPECFTHVEYMVASDKQGVIIKGTRQLCAPRDKWNTETRQPTAKPEPLFLKLKEQDRHVFVHVTCTRPEHRELVHFVDLEELRKCQVTAPLPAGVKPRVLA